MTLKAQYLEQEQRNFPALGGGPVAGVYDDIVEKEKDDEENETNTGLESKLAELEKTVADIPVLKESLAKAQADLRRERKANYVAQNKVKFARQVTEKRLAECLPETTTDEDSHLIVLYSSLLNEDDFEIDLATNIVKPKDGLFDELEENLDNTDPNFETHLSLLKNKVLGRIKVNRERRISRRDSISSNSSISESRKRESEDQSSLSDPSRFKVDPTSSSQVQ